MVERERFIKRHEETKVKTKIFKNLTKIFLLCFIYDCTEQLFLLDFCGFLSMSPLTSYLLSLTSYLGLRSFSLHIDTVFVFFVSKMKFYSSFTCEVCKIFVPSRR